MKVLEGQSLLDIAIQELGSAEGAFDLAVLNELSITDELEVGIELILPEVVNTDIVSYYAKKRLCIATALVAQAELIQSVVDSFFIIAPTNKIGVAIVLDGQNIVDIATQYCGSADAAFDIAILNGLSPTVDLTPGIELKLPSAFNKKIAEYYKTKALQPATNAIIQTGGGGGTPTDGEGIGYWAIEIDFVIN